MSTQVESYLQEELVDLVTDPEALDKWHSTVAELGLTGQGSIAKPEKSPVPYLHMTPSMVATFETLCPREVELKEYKSGAIPLEALEHIKLALREGHFGRIMIRYDDKAPDPVAIGEVGHRYTYGTGGKIPGVVDWQEIESPEKIEEVRAAGHTIGFQPKDRFLIARWGAERDTLENLAAKAKARHIREKGADLGKRIKEAQAEMNTLEEEATIKFGC